MAKYLAVLFVVACVKTVHCSLTWGQIKGCATVLIDACHDKCQAEASIDVSVGDTFKKCEEDMVVKIVAAQESCLKRNGWQITDSSPCFKDDDEPDSSRFRRQLFDQIGKLKQYSGCIKSCKTDPDIKAKISATCDRSKCDDIAGQKEKKAFAACKGKGDSVKQSDMATVMSSGVACMMPAILG